MLRVLHLSIFFESGKTAGVGKIASVAALSDTQCAFDEPFVTYLLSYMCIYISRLTPAAVRKLLKFVNEDNTPSPSSPPSPY